MFFASTEFAATITAIQNGSWTSNSTWNLNRQPSNNDVVIIPAGRTVYFEDSPYPKNNPTGRPTLIIQIYGTLDFSDAGNDKMYLDAGSMIEILSTGRIRTSTNSTEIVAIYNGTADNTVWQGSPSTINGPSYATGFTAGFINGILPLVLTSFDIMRIDKTHGRLIWVTNEEVNTSHFEVELFKISNRSWVKIGNIEASHNSSSEKTYNFVVTLTDEGLNEYRLKQVDNNGHYTYSPVRSLQYRESGVVNVYYNRNAGSLQIEGISQENKNSDVALYDLNGKKILQKNISNGISTVQVPANIHGIYVVRLSTAGSESLLIRKIFIQ
jgi:hypothetical protein